MTRYSAEEERVGISNEAMAAAERIFPHTSSEEQRAVAAVDIQRAIDAIFYVYRARIIDLEKLANLVAPLTSRVDSLKRQLSYHCCGSGISGCRNALRQCSTCRIADLQKCNSEAVRLLKLVRDHRLCAACDDDIGALLSANA